MSKKISKLSRITPTLEESLLKAMEYRYKRKLCTYKDINMREATELLTRTRGINMSLEEIRTLPKRRKKK